MSQGSYPETVQIGTGNLELTKEEVDKINGSARQFYQEKYGGRKSISPKTPTELVLPVSDTQLDMPMASETVEPDPLSKMLDEKLETYFADRENRYKKETRRSEQRKRNTPGSSAIFCHYCKRKGVNITILCGAASSSSIIMVALLLRPSSI